MAHHLMLLPSLACPGRCTYCFGPHEGGGSMERSTLEAIVRWQIAADDESPLEVTFHGGEPLLPGVGFYRQALPLLRQGLAARRVRFAVQSNLWLLTDELCDLFADEEVALSTSLDGPEEINDAQRGPGHYRRTMAGIARARAHGLEVGCICTFTAGSALHANEVFDFFLQEGLRFNIHPAIPSLHSQQMSLPCWRTTDHGNVALLTDHASRRSRIASRITPHGSPPEQPHWALLPDAYGTLLVDMLERYLGHLDRVRIGTLDAMARSVSAQQGGICTFSNCLGHYLAIGPDGVIYPCQRLAGNPAFALGNVHDAPDRARLSAAPAWRLFAERQERITEECGDCPYLAICWGGCPYAALAAGGDSLRDPYCPAYRRFFAHVTERALAEVFAPENLEAVVERPDPDRGLLRHGRLLSLLKGAPHPYEAAQRARRALAAVALAATTSTDEGARRLAKAGVTDATRAEAMLNALQRRLNAPPRGLNNLYLHVTSACNLRCTHCYAEAGPERHDALAVTDVLRACREAAALGFRQAVITGGEPLLHPQRDDLLAALAALRQEIRPLALVLRTNLAVDADTRLLQQIRASVDEVVVSLDGDAASHDVRRGAGSHARAVANLRALVALGGGAEVSLAAVLSAEQVNGPAGEAVRALAREMQVRRVRFRPLLPLGRAAASAPDLAPAGLWGHLDPCGLVAYGFSPRASCGLGQSLYVRPDGTSYPCYAWCGAGWMLGDITAAEGLRGVVESSRFRDLARHTVATNRRCRHCALRYLCGGTCRAWQTHELEDLDAPPADCTHLQARARAILVAALQQLQVPAERWLEAGLPLVAS